MSEKESKEDRKKTDKELLDAIFQRLQESPSLDELFSLVERDMLLFLRAERLTIYQKSRLDRGIVSRYRSEDDHCHEIRLALSPSSIAGYVALSHRSLRIDDVHDEVALAAIHPALRFDDRFDQKSGFRTRSMVVTPIKFGNVLLGLLQVINRIGGGPFSELDLSHAQDLARVICHKLRQQFESTRGPFDYLVAQGMVSNEKINEIKRTVRTTGEIAQSLMRDLGIPLAEIGASLERYFQASFMAFDPTLRLPGELLRPLNISYLQRQGWVPVEGTVEQAVVLMEDPSDAVRLLDVQSVLKAQSYEFRVGLREDIRRYLEVWDKQKNEVREEMLPDVAPPMVEVERVEENRDQERGGGGEADLAVAQFVNRLIMAACKVRAAVLFVEAPEKNHAGVAKLRIGDQFHILSHIPPHRVRDVVDRFKVLGRLEAREGGGQSQSGTFKVKYGGKVVMLHLATVPAALGWESVALHLEYSV